MSVIMHLELGVDTTLLNRHLAVVMVSVGVVKMQA